MNTLAPEELRTLDEILDQHPALRHLGTSRVALCRWCREGLSGIRCQHVLAGRKVLTTAAAIDEFMRAQAEVTAPRGRRDPKKDHKPSKAAASADAELAAAGF